MGRAAGPDRVSAIDVLRCGASYRPFRCACPNRFGGRRAVRAIARRTPSQQSSCQTSGIFARAGFKLTHYPKLRFSHAAEQRDSTISLAGGGCAAGSWNSLFEQAGGIGPDRAAVSSGLARERGLNLGGDVNGDRQWVLLSGHATAMPQPYPAAPPASRSRPALLPQPTENK